MTSFAKNRLDSILESVDAAIITINTTGIIIDINPATSRMFGYQETDLVGENVKILMPLPYQDEHDGYLQHHVRTGEKRIIGIGRKVSGLRKNGTQFPMHLSVAKFEEGDSIFFTGIIHDLTELEQAQSISHRLGMIVEESVNEIYTFSTDSLRFTSANRVALKNLGYTRQELNTITPVDIVRNLTESDLRKTLQPLISKKKDRVHFSSRLLRLDGSTYDADVHLHLSAAFSPPEFVAIVQDVTENKRMVETLRHTQKMESIGNLTGGIAHDFNNILTVVMGNLELLEIGIDDADNQELIREARDAADMGARLTRRLLAFARRSTLAPVQININSLILDISEMLGRTLGENIHLQTELDSELWDTHVDISELENALVNLCINARDSMESGGSLTIKTANSPSMNQHPSAADSVAGQFVSVAITDTGTGIPETIRDKIFEPFVSTKSGTHGTGLGLSMVYGFVKQSGGHISVDTEINKGSTFRLYLPAVKSRKTPEMLDPGTQPNSLNTSNKTILVVEDDNKVRKLTVTRLERMGYHVLQAEDGHAALAVYQNSEKIDLVFSDVVMTEGMSGYDLATAIRQIDSTTPIILTSGYAENIVNAEKLAESNLNLLHKPYHQNELAEALRLIFAHN